MDSNQLAFTEAGKEYVDLGLSVMWAMVNVDAAKPEDTGGYYAWAETRNKSYYGPESYSHCDWSMTELIKYCRYERNGHNGFTDGINKIELADDVAHVRWGGKWRIPSLDEFKELIDKCTWQPYIRNGQKGFVITSNIPGFSDRSIFLPAAGRRIYDETEALGDKCYYWTSLLGSYVDGIAIGMIAGVFANHGYDGIPRDHGLSIRPVF